MAPSQEVHVSITNTQNLAAENSSKLSDNQKSKINDLDTKTQITYTMQNLESQNEYIPSYLPCEQPSSAMDQRN